MTPLWERLLVATLVGLLPSTIIGIGMVVNDAPVWATVAFTTMTFQLLFSIFLWTHEPPKKVPYITQDPTE